MTPEHPHHLSTVNGQYYPYWGGALLHVDTFAHNKSGIAYQSKNRRSILYTIDYQECLSLSLRSQVYDYDRLCPTDDLLGTTEVFFTEEELEKDKKHHGQKVSELDPLQFGCAGVCQRWPCLHAHLCAPYCRHGHCLPLHAESLPQLTAHT
jgi:hypothetical protein